MKSRHIQERVMAIALSAASVIGTLALFGSVPLLAKLSQSEHSPFSTGQNSSVRSSDS